MKKNILIILLLIGQIVFSQKIYKKTHYNLMGSFFEFAVVASSEQEGAFFIAEALKEVMRIEDLLSSWRDYTQTSAVNKNAGIAPVKVDRELFDLIKRCNHISKMTDGAFDISFESIDKIWYFDKKMEKIPDSLTIRKSIEKINYKNIILDEGNRTVFLKEKGMKIGFGGIGQGYGAEKVKEKLIKMGVVSGLINASGDITTWGDHPENKTWKIAIKNPDHSKNDIAWFNIHNSSVSTSGNYENYIIINGVRHGHTIDPKTGWPSKGLQSVTVFCDNLELSDALDTAVFVMGVKKGLSFVNQLKGVECLLLDDNNELFYSNGLKNK
ncbi:thiamine biosynthesis protein ApbE [Flavobacterium oncorhynchi]|uniref:FAD:protein FMN transferase n=1 Tax=Flavobacterium oncorhynchi TaxID=728056 RepID=A0A226HIY1_9FLAO|nr:FAD:protein FMN transferase [Flavobacterium oncorhynchi]OXA94125.1 thiamine biosynthesis protein ApbE [Flavobacterium oncorhynchi]